MSTEVISMWESAGLPLDEGWIASLDRAEARGDRLGAMAHGPRLHLPGPSPHPRRQRRALRPQGRLPRPLPPRRRPPPPHEPSQVALPQEVPRPQPLLRARRLPSPRQGLGAPHPRCLRRRPPLHRQQRLRPDDAPRRMLRRRDHPPLEDRRRRPRGRAEPHRQHVVDSPRGGALLMLENQLPFFLLQLLFDYGPVFPRRLDFAKCAVEFFAAFADMELELPPDGAGKGGFCHLLHILHSCINPRKEAGEANPRLNISSPNNSRATRVKSIPSATRLSEAGVKFKRKLTKNMLDITFHNSKMEIPQLGVNDHINTLFRNLIAFEQGYRCASRHVTSYASLMDSIIDTPADVTLLQKGDIIVNGLGDNEDVAALFNKLCSGAAIDDGRGYLASVFVEANRHYNRQWNQFLSILRRDYFGNPWSAIALMAAILLFCLTSTQTVFSVLAYVRQ